MHKRNQTVFAIEHLHPDWLDNPSHVNIYRGFSGVIYGLVIGVSLGMLVDTAFGVIGSFLFGMVAYYRTSNEEVERHINQDRWKSLKRGLIIIGVGLCFGLILGLLSGFRFGIGLGLFSGLKFGFDFGLQNSLHHFLLRCLLYWHNYTPWNYTRFLNYAVELGYLYKVDDGYAFVDHPHVI
ncbi:MAG: hypothetical protein AAF639_20300 [Chloroflexota bacterium]